MRIWLQKSIFHFITDQNSSQIYTLRKIYIAKSNRQGCGCPLEVNLIDQSTFSLLKSLLKVSLEITDDCDSKARIFFGLVEFYAHFLSNDGS